MAKVATSKVLTVRLCANMSPADSPTLELTADALIFERAAHDLVWTRLSNDTTTHDITFRAKTPVEPAAILVNACTDSCKTPSRIHAEEYNIDAMEEFRGYFVLIIRLRDRKKPKKTLFGLSKTENSSPGGILKTSIPVLVAFAIPSYEQVEGFDINLIKECFGPTKCELKTMDPFIQAKLATVQEQLNKVGKMVVPSAQGELNSKKLPLLKEMLKDSMGKPEWAARWKAFDEGFLAVHDRQGLRQEWFMLKEWESEIRKECGMTAVLLGLDPSPSPELALDYLRISSPDV